MTTLLQLADSLAATAEDVRCGAQAITNPAYAAGYRDALLDTRATVLSMIDLVNHAIAANNRIDRYEQAVLDGRIEAYEDIRGEKEGTA